MRNILVVDDEENMLHMLKAYLSRQGYEVECCLNGEQALNLIEKKIFDVVLCDVKMPVMDGIEFLRIAKERGYPLVFIMMSAYATVDAAVEAMKLGAYDFVTKPFKVDEILCVLQRAEEVDSLKKENFLLKEKLYSLGRAEGFASIVGESKAIRESISMAQRVAPYDSPVLITGESGTGKELFAKGIHAESGRRRNSFVAVNCGSIPGSLLESEFFGFVKGAFTGADRDKLGLMALADGGTLFLDEIGELPQALQVKLLRVLQEKEFRPIGSTKSEKVNVRVITATAKDIGVEVSLGNFRLDLFYRLNVVQLSLPPLRARDGDLSILAHHFIRKYNMERGEPSYQMANSALKILEQYSWPGNVRELENVIQFSMIYAHNKIIDSTSLPDWLFRSEASENFGFLQTDSIKEGRVLLEKYLIQRALASTKGNKSQAAVLLDISYPSLLSKIKEYAIVYGDRLPE